MAPPKIGNRLQALLSGALPPPPAAHLSNSRSILSTLPRMRASVQEPVHQFYARIPPVAAAPKERWSNYRQRVLDKLGPVSESLREDHGVEPELLLAGNGLVFQAPPSALTPLLQRNDVHFIDLDEEFKLAELNEVLPQVGAPAFARHFPTLDGKGVRVAVLDTGIDPQHPMLSVEKAVSMIEEGIDQTGDHGTHVAGIIASRDKTYRGIAHGVTLLSVKVLTSQGVGRASTVLKGIDKALDMGAEILSMSLGFNHLPTGQSTLNQGMGWECPDGHCVLCTAVDNITTAQGVLVVAAAGNQHFWADILRSQNKGNTFDTELDCPGQARGALTVGSVEKEDFAPAASSSRGPTSYKESRPVIATIGEEVTSTIRAPRLPNGQVDEKADHSAFFGTKSGTSMATPVLSGVAALIIQQLKATGRTWTPAQLTQLLKQATSPISGATANDVGAGRLDLDKLAGVLSTHCSGTA